VHQGSELYGSDRSFMQCVGILRHMYPNADITILLPSNGPLVGALSNLQCRIEIAPLWILRKKGAWHRFTFGLFALFFAVLRAARRCRASDLVYVNTAVVADYFIAARLFPGKVVVHVREIPVGLGHFLISRLIRFSRADIIFNSRATMDAFPLHPLQKSFVVYNGVGDQSIGAPITYDGTRPLRLLLLGRINAWKGQDFFVTALGHFKDAHARLVLRIVGGVFEDNRFDLELTEKIDALGLGEIVTVEPFSAETGPLFEWADIVTVPSLTPEPFGRVAIEAFSFGRPVIAAAHGGLLEVVEANRSGWLFKPSDANSLTDVLHSILADPMSVATAGQSARRRYEECFTEQALERAFSAAIIEHFEVTHD
jgi:Glycosyltransferase